MKMKIGKFYTKGKNIIGAMSFIFVASFLSGCAVQESDVNVSEITDLMDSKAEATSDTTLSEQNPTNQIEQGENASTVNNANNASDASDGQSMSTNDLISGFESYKDKRFNYSISYLSNFETTEKDNGVLFKNEADSCVISVTMIKSENAADDELIKNSTEIIFQRDGYINISSRNVANSDATSIKYVIEGVERGEEIIVRDSNKRTFVINLSTKEENYGKYKKTFSDVISSFKFDNTDLNNTLIGNIKDSQEIGDIGSLLDQTASDDKKDIIIESTEVTTDQIMRESNSPSNNRDLFNKLDNMGKTTK